MRVLVSAENYTYPDFVVVCGAPEFKDAEVDILLNPTLIIQVLSSSTENYDRGQKFQNYRMLPSLQEYVLISQQMPQIEHYQRQDNHQWLLTDVTDFQNSASLTSIGCTLALVDVYDKVMFNGEANSQDN